MEKGEDGMCEKLEIAQVKCNGNRNGVGKGWKVRKIFGDVIYSLNLILKLW